MDKELFRKTEGRLYRYYNSLKKIKCMELECEELEKQKEKIRRDIKEVNVDIEAELNMGIDYSVDKVQSSSDGTSYAEKSIIVAIDKLEKEWIYVRKKLLKKTARIREVEREIVPIKSNLSMLSEENKIFIEWKYGECKSVEWIATEVYGGARSTAYRKREELIEDVGQWCELIK